MAAQAPNILIVDDDPLVLRAIDRTLRRGGYRTVATEDPIQARQLLDVVPVDAVVADLNLAIDDGRCFAASVRQEHSQPVVVVTGTQDFRDVTRMLGGQAPSALLAKPFEGPELVRVLASVLRAATHPGDEPSVIRELAQGMARALALRDVETHAHAQRVALWTHRLGRAVGMDARALFWAEIGALLHDVGKIGVPDHILKKPGPLDDTEWAVMRTHADLGAELIAPVKRLAGARDLVRHHHEAWDGSGYPDGLAGEAIPLAARVFAPVDTYDAMTSDRPYRRGMCHEVAMGRIVAAAGTQFDPSVIAALERIDGGEWIAIRATVDARGLGPPGAS